MPSDAAVQPADIWWLSVSSPAALLSSAVQWGILNLWNSQTWRCQWILTICQSEWHSANALLECTVACKLHSCQMLIPDIVCRVNVVSDHIYDDSVQPLSLAICLWMVCRRHHHSDANLLAECLSKVTGELSISVRYDISWQTVMLDYIVDEHPCNLWSCRSISRRYYVRQLSQPVNHDI